MTFAHEVGHNMGAEHDEDVNCSSGYIMSSSGSTKISHTDQEFSQCSIEAIHKCIDEVKSKPYRNCFKYENQRSHDYQGGFSICGNYKVEGDEECDCGMSYQSCSDPCCYAAHISPKDLSWNSSAIPCRTHKSPNCLHPFRSALIFGILTPWIFIGSCILALTIGLCYDWKHDRKCFKHMDADDEKHSRRISKSEPRSLPPSRPLSPPIPPRVQKAKAPAPPLVAPYLPPLRSQSQPPPILEKLNSFEMTSPRNHIQRPTEPPPPIPLISPISSPTSNAKSPPPPVPYNTRPNISEVAYLKKKFENN